MVPRRRGSSFHATTWPLVYCGRMRLAIRPISRLWLVPLLLGAGLLTADLVAMQLVRASSDEAWDALIKEAGAVCQMASELENPRVLWSNPAYERQAALIVT